MERPEPAKKPESLKTKDEIRYDALEEAAHLCELMEGEMFNGKNDAFRRCAAAIRDLALDPLVLDARNLCREIEKLPQSEKAQQVSLQASRLFQNIKERTSRNLKSVIP